MNQIFLSLVVGFLVAAITTMLFLDYKPPWITYTCSATDSLSKPTITKAVDIDFLFYLTIFSIIRAIVVYGVWTYIENTPHENFRGVS
ncbi:hypothetical protein [Planococcus donghaensis]|uniref:Uncharacterized protein n=1 Tax=Planococcus donghaensis TaxID=414778 RepID=A0A1C7EHF3_9BACL|nr:hypothetical protein [Planococcus donghaensis]ANU23091.1 hypothetical protein BCM40_06805 [Planococcus donghaensis]